MSGHASWASFLHHIERRAREIQEARRELGSGRESDKGVATPDMLIAKRHQAHGHGLWLRPNLLEIGTTEIALREVTAQLEPAQEEEAE
jgi:hypothetical protein